MVIKEKGKKHTCQSCGALFYDLKSKPILCPKCGTEVKARSRSKLHRSKTRSVKPIEKKVDKAVDLESDMEAVENNMEDLDVDVVVEDKDEDDLIEDMSDMNDDDDMSEVKDHMGSNSDDKD